MDYIYDPNTGELCHHGIKGMRWGIRRTPAQLGHKTKSGKSSSSGKKPEPEKKSEKTSSETEAPKKKSISEMSDDELRAAINRIQLEKSYAAAIAQPKQISTGKKFVDKVVTEMVVPAATDIGKQAVKSLMADAVNKAMGFEGESKVYSNNKKK